MGHADDGNSVLMKVVPVVALVAADAYEEFQLFEMTFATGWRMLTYGSDDEQEDVKVTAEEVEVHLGVGRNVEETLEDSNGPLFAVVSVGNVVVWIETEDLQQEQKQRRFLSQLGFDAVSLQELGSGMEQLVLASELDLATNVLAGYLAEGVVVLIAEIVVMQVAE